MDATKKNEYAALLLGMVPETGTNVGNLTLRQQLRTEVSRRGDELTDQDYWTLRDSLIDEGVIAQGRGKGGSVHRVAIEAAPVPDGGAELVGQQEQPVAEPGRIAEANLYEPFHSAVKAGYVKENRIKRFISQITASQGRRATGGKWTRPDLTIVAVRSYQFTPGKRLEVITFEIKPDLDGALEGAYEALAHSAFAHRSYLAVDIRAYADQDDIPDDRIVQECTRHGVGYLTFSDPANYDTYEIVCTARLNEPDPYEVDNFIRTQINPEYQEELREHLQ